MELAAAHSGAVDRGLEFEAAVGCCDSNTAVGYATLLLVQEFDDLFVCYDIGVCPYTRTVGDERRFELIQRRYLACLVICVYNRLSIEQTGVAEGYEVLCILAPARHRAVLVYIWLA